MLYALRQHDLKRLLAFHSVENIGIILIGVGLAMILWRREDAGASSRPWRSRLPSCTPSTTRHSRVSSFSARAASAPGSYAALDRPAATLAGQRITTDIVEVLYGKGPKARHDTL